MSKSSDSPLVVVTGGAGFIGSHTVDRLVEAGRQVVVLDDFSTGKRQNLARWAGDDRVEIVPVDIVDGVFSPLADVARRRGPVDSIVHLAAQTAVVQSVANPIGDARANYLSTLHVLEYARRERVRKVVFASSAAVYGDVEELPVAETAPCAPVSPYGIDKRASELALHYYTAVHGVSTQALRFFNVYGPRQDPSSPYSGVISVFVDNALAGRPLTIFGDGEQTRDFVFVGDVARTVVTACLENGGREVVNVATGREITITKLARTAVDLCGADVPIRHGDARPGEIHRSVAAVDRLREGFGITAEVRLADGLRDTIHKDGSRRE